MTRNYNRVCAIVLVLAVCICMLSVLSCARREYTDAIINYPITADAKNLDPQLASDLVSVTVLQNTMEGLTTLASDGEIALGMAHTVRISRDGLTYTFTMRDNITWSNGEPVTSQDFVFGLQRLFDPQTRSSTAYKLFCIKHAKDVYDGRLPVQQLGVFAQGNTLTIQLESKNDNFLKLLTLPAAMPCNKQFFEQTKGKYGTDAQYLLYNGPLYLKSWLKKDGLYLRKNELYYAAHQVFYYGVDMLLQPDQDTVGKNFLSKRADVAQIGSQLYQKVLDGNYCYEKKRLSTWGILFNLQDPFFENASIRQGMRLGFDRSTYQEVLEAYLQSAAGFVPPDLLLYDQLVGELKTDAPTDLEAAKRAYQQGQSQLQQSGYTSKTMIVPQGIDHKRLFDYPSMVWQKNLNLFINVEVLPVAEYRQRLQNGTFELALYELCSEDETVAGLFDSFLSQNGKNYSGFSDVRLDTLSASLAQAEDEWQYLAAIGQMMQIVNDAEVFIPMYHPVKLVAMQKNVTDILYNPQTGAFYFKFAYKT